MAFTIRDMLGRRGPERRSLVVGYVPTLDAATLLVARDRGFFAAEGLEVTLQKQTSWHRAHQRLDAGKLDAAHLPGTTPLAAHLGLIEGASPLITAIVLALGGSSLGLSPALAAELQRHGSSSSPGHAATALAQLLAERREQGLPRLRFAVADRHSIGSYDLRYWLASASIDPARDVDMVPVTPGRILNSLRRGDRYDGAWMDEPYGTLAAQEGTAVLMFSKHAFWNHSLGKVLAVRGNMPRRFPRTHRALLRALLQAAHWLEENRENVIDELAEAGGILLSGHSRSVLADGIRTRAGQQPEDLCFARCATTFPWYSQAVWYLGQMIRWGDYTDVLDFKKTAQSVFQPALYREAARELSLPYPSIGYKSEGLHRSEWVLDEASAPITMGSDCFFDGRQYDPRQTMKYLNGLEINHIQAPLDAMWAIR